MIHTLESLCGFLNESIMDDSHALRTTILSPLQETLGEFSKLKRMLEECIDIGKAKQNDYIINPEFSPELKQLSLDINKVKKKMDSLKNKVVEDLKINKTVNLVESNQYTFVFETDKKEGDAGMRSSKIQYKIISIKNKVMSFTSNELKDLVREFNDLED
jgi:DNA mismatch repair protein MSH2